MSGSRPAAEVGPRYIVVAPSGMVGNAHPAESCYWPRALAAHSLVAWHVSMARL